VIGRSLYVASNDRLMRFDARKGKDEP